MPISPPKRRAPRRLGAALAAAGTLALVLTGCVGTPEPTSTPTPTEEAPIFASDEEALAAAVKAYELYAAASQQITDDGGTEPERIDPFVTPSFAVALHEEFAAFQESGVHSQGKITADHESLVEWSQEGGAVSASIYLCRDVSEVRAIGPDGVDVTPEDRADRVPSQAFFVSDAKRASTLLVDRIETWTGDDFC
ncbi:hypothetical protein [Agromyces neolithicus]